MILQRFILFAAGKRSSHVQAIILTFPIIRSKGPMATLKKNSANPAASVRDFHTTIIYVWLSASKITELTVCSVNRCYLNFAWKSHQVRGVLLYFRSFSVHRTRETCWLAPGQITNEHFNEILLLYDTVIMCSSSRFCDNPPWLANWLVILVF